MYGSIEGVTFYTIATDYLVDNRLYQVVQIKAYSYPDENDIQKFNGSFELIH